MTIFTLKQKIFIVKRYYQSGNSKQVVQYEYPTVFFGLNIPTDDNINELINLFEQFGSVSTLQNENIDDGVGGTLYYSFGIKQECDPLFNDHTESFSETKININNNKLELGDVSVENVVGDVKPNIPFNYEISVLSNRDSKFHPVNSSPVVDKNECIDDSSEIIDGVGETLYYSFGIKQECDPLFNNHTESSSETKTNINNNKLELGDVSVENVVEDVKPNVPFNCEISVLSNRDSKFHPVNGGPIVGKNECIDDASETIVSLRAINTTDFPCEQCDRRFKSKAGYSNHVKTHNKGQTDESKSFSFEVKQQCNWNDDSNSETETTDTQQNIGIADDSNDKTSYPKTKRKTDNEKDSDETKTKHYSCEQCDRSFTSKRGYSNHVKIHDKVCRLCKKTGCKSMDVVPIELQLPLDRKFKCCLCEKLFKSRSDLLCHGRGHLTDEERPHKCEVCNKGFIKKSALKLHFGTHMGKKYSSRNPKNVSQSMVCDVCGQIFSSKLTLKIHYRKHTGETPYECAFCDKKFNNISSIVKHKVVHTGERPYKCEICKKSYSEKGNLKAHIDRIHGGAKPHQCPFCNNKYTTRNALIIHKRLHTGERPYNCQYCSEDFYDPATWRRHELRHKGIKPKCYKRKNKQIRKSKPDTCNEISHEQK